MKQQISFFGFIFHVALWSLIFYVVYFELNFKYEIEKAAKGLLDIVLSKEFVISILAGFLITNIFILVAFLGEKL